MKFAIVMIGLIGAAQSSYAVDLSDQCKESIQTKVAAYEADALVKAQQTIAGDLIAEVENTTRAKDGKISVTVTVVDSMDGRSVIYSAEPTADEAKNCKIKLSRTSAAYCRFSTVGGEEELATISGMSVIEEKKVTLNDMEGAEAKQVTAIIGERGKDLKEAFTTIDAEVLIKYEIKTPDERVLNYYKYAVEGAIAGVAFAENSTKIIGMSAEDRICIK